MREATDRGVCRASLADIPATTLSNVDGTGPENRKYRSRSDSLRCSARTFFAIRRTQQPDRRHRAVGEGYA